MNIRGTAPKKEGKMRIRAFPVSIFYRFLLFVYFVIFWLCFILLSMSGQFIYCFYGCFTESGIIYLKKFDITQILSARLQDGKTVF